MGPSRPQGWQEAGDQAGDHPDGQADRDDMATQVVSDRHAGGAREDLW